MFWEISGVWMNKKVICLIIATAVVSSITTLGGTFLYSKAQAQNVTKGSGGCPISEIFNNHQDFQH